MIDLGTLGGANSYGLDISGGASPVIVGVSDTAQAGVTRPFIYDVNARTLTELPASLGGVSAAATAVNLTRHVAGYADLLTPGVQHAFLFADGVTHDLGSFGGNSEARALNDSDVVVGAAWLDATTRHAFRYAGGVLQDLGTLGGASSEAADVSNDGTVVGWAEDGSGSRRAFAWQNGSMVDLNTQINPSAGWVLEAATGVSSAGAIVGYGRHDGQVRAFMLTPAANSTIHVDVRRHSDGLDTSFPEPSEAGQTFTLGATVTTTGRFPVGGLTMVQTFSGAVEIVSIPAGCVQDGVTVSCPIAGTLDPISTNGRDVYVRVRSTSAGTFTHSAFAFNDAVRSNTDSETRTAISLASLTAESTTVVGGQQVLARATLTGPTGAGGTRVLLASSNPAVASVPERFDVVPFCCDGLWREFYITTVPVTTPTSVTISATMGLVTQTVPLTILPAGGGGGGGGDQGPLVTWTDPVNVTVGPGAIQKTAGLRWLLRRQRPVHPVDRRRGRRAAVHRHRPDAAADCRLE